MTTWPLDNTMYTAQAIGAFTGTRTRGVFCSEDCYKVSAAGAFDITVQPGLAWLKKEKFWGVAVLETEQTTLTLDVGSGLAQRYAAIVLQLDKTANLSSLIVKYGDYTGEKPLPVRDDFYDEIIIAYCLQQAGAAEITSMDITDTRLDEELCGVMKDAVTGIPTQSFSEKFTQLTAELEQELKGVESREGLMLMSSYDPQNLGVDVTIQPYEHLDENTLEGIGSHGIFVAKYSAKVNQFFCVNLDSMCKVKIDGEEDYLNMKEGACYQFYVTNETGDSGDVVYCLNFKLGGASLNYSVIGGTTEPQLPTENTIWLNTSVEITSYAFGTTTPTAQQGKAYFYVSTSAPTTINVLKENEILLPISMAYIYNNNAWQQVNVCKIYQNGQWVPLELYVLNANNYYTSITGGWQKTSGNTFSYISSGVRLVAGASWFTNVSTVYTIDATAFTTMTVTYYVYAPSTISGHVAFGSAYHNVSGGTRTVNIDISNITGPQKISANIHAQNDSAGGAYLDIRMIKFS